MLVILILIILYILNKKSKSDFFYGSNLNEKLNLIKHLYKEFGYTETEIKKLEQAYNFFISNPKRYNGTSVVNDRYMINGLEPQSVVHDYDWIVANNLKDLINSNYRYTESLRKVNVNWFYCWFLVYCGLNLVATFKGIILIFKK